jgi:hypothetical protein
LTVIKKHNDGILDDLDGQWMKFCGLLMSKLGLDAVTITVADVEKFASKYPGDIPCVVVDGRGGKDVTLRVMSLKGAERFYSQTKQD